MSFSHVYDNSFIQPQLGNTCFLICATNVSYKIVQMISFTRANAIVTCKNRHIKRACVHVLFLIKHISIILSRKFISYRLH